jgi:hypothetical protein
MLDYLSILHPKQVEEGSWSRREFTLREHNYKIALSYETAGDEM